MSRSSLLHVIHINRILQDINIGMNHHCNYNGDHDCNTIVNHVSRMYQDIPDLADRRQETRRRSIISKCYTHHVIMSLCTLNLFVINISQNDVLEKITE